MSVVCLLAWMNDAKGREKSRILSFQKLSSSGLCLRLGLCLWSLFGRMSGATHQRQARFSSVHCSNLPGYNRICDSRCLGHLRIRIRIRSYELVGTEEEGGDQRPSDNGLKRKLLERKREREGDARKGWGGRASP